MTNGTTHTRYAPAPSSPPGTPAAQVIDAQWRWFVEALEQVGPGGLAVPTRLAGWDVESLVRHVHWGTTMEARALELALDGPAGVRADGEQMPPDATQAVPALAQARARLAEALSRAATAPEDLLVPLPYGDVPLPLALDVFTMEAAVHRTDLAAALEADPALDPASFGPTARTLQAFWGALATAGTPPESPAGLALRGSVVEICSRWDGASWGSLEGCPEAVVVGSDESLLLYALGRADFDQLELRVGGDESIARRFKEFVPGP